MRVLIHGHVFFSLDMLWGFQQAGCDAQIIEKWEAERFIKIEEENGADLMVTLGAPLELSPEILSLLGNRPATLKHVHWDTDGISSKRYLSKSGDGIEMDVIYTSKPNLVLTMCPEMHAFITEKGFACERMSYLSHSQRTNCKDNRI